MDYLLEEQPAQIQQKSRQLPQVTAKPTARPGHSIPAASPAPGRAPSREGQSRATGGQRDSSPDPVGGSPGEPHPAPSAALPAPRARPAVRGSAGRREGGGEEGGKGGRSRLASPFPLAGFLCSISMLEVPTELRSEDLPGCAGPSSFLCASPSPVQAVPPRPGRHVPAASPPPEPPPALEAGGSRPPGHAEPGQRPGTGCHVVPAPPCRPGRGTEAASPPASPPASPHPSRSALGRLRAPLRRMLRVSPGRWC